MKKIVLVSILLSLVLTSCDKNDNQQNDPQQPTDGFTINGTFYETPNCYIEFDGDTNPDHINVFLTDGRMYDNSAQAPTGAPEFLFSTNTSNIVYFAITENMNPSLTQPSYPNIQTGIQYAGDPSDTVIGHAVQVNSINPPFIVNNIEYGMAVENSGTTHTQGAAGSFMTLNSYNYDANTQTGTINLDYTFTDANGVNITGHYEGTFGVFAD